MIWKVIKEYPNYSVSDTGVVKRNTYTRIDKLGRKTKVKEMILKQHIDKDGYLRVTLVKNGKNYFVPLHRIIAKAFIPNPNNYPVINHKNENKKDNSLKNLEWCTVSYNNNYGNRQKKVSKTQGKKVIGTNETKTIIFNSANEAEKYFTNKKGSVISQCANGKFKSAYGYQWRWLINGYCK